MNGDLFDPTPELPDDTPIQNVRFSTRLRNVLAAADLTTVEVRETADETLLSFQDFGPGSVTHRKTLGLPSIGLDAAGADMDALDLKQAGIVAARSLAGSFWALRN